MNFLSYLLRSIETPFWMHVQDLALGPRIVLPFIWSCHITGPIGVDPIILVQGLGSLGQRSSIYHNKEFVDQFTVFGLHKPYRTIGGGSKS